MADEEPYDFGFGPAKPEPEADKVSISLHPNWTRVNVTGPQFTEPEFSFRAGDGSPDVMQSLARSGDMEAMLARMIRVLLDHTGGSLQLGPSELMFILASQNYPEVAIERDGNSPPTIRVLNDDLKTK